MSKEVDHRITTSWKRYGEFNSCMKDKKIPLCLTNTVILPAMVYGAETWSLTRNQERKLQVAQRSMERLMPSEQTTLLPAAALISRSLWGEPG